MVKGIGVLIVIWGSSGLGFSVVRERKAYLAQCREWREILTLIENEIAFQKSSLPEICSRAGSHLAGDKKLFLEDIGRTFESGEGGTFREIWRREAEKVFSGKPLKKEVEEEIKGIGEKLCFEDAEMQRKMLRDVETYLRKHEEEQEESNKEKNKLTLCAGVMGGLLLTILFL